MVGKLLLGAVLLIISARVSEAQTTYYWDTNGGTSGAGGATPSGDWGTGNGAGNRRWGNSGGTATTGSWINGDIAVFSAGTDATGSYTVTLGTSGGSSGAVTAHSISVEEGNPTITGGTLTLGGTGSTGSIQVASGSTLTINSAIAGSVGLNKSGGGILALGGANTYTGTTVVSGGTLQANTTLDFSSGLQLGAGTTLALNNQAVTVGTLTITGNSVIDFSSGASSLTVGTLVITSGTLTIIGWTNAVDFFYASNFTGVTLGGSTSTVVFTGYSGPSYWQSYDNQITPIPEPTAFGALFMGLATGGYLLRRRPR